AHPLDAARCGVLLGQALHRLGERDRALAELECAHTILDECGALRYRDAAARELRLLGRRVAHCSPPRGTRKGVLGLLSGRERQVAELVAAGRTNGEIADELFVSTKTVETYLSRAFGKLGVSSRAAVAGTVERARADG
ncbi:MAG: response regulator transcription factor, partial [Thermoleophilaceae bacterium]